jgi:hypothetical protein
MDIADPLQKRAIPDQDGSKSRGEMPRMCTAVTLFAAIPLYDDPLIAIRL